MCVWNTIEGVMEWSKFGKVKYTKTWVTSERMTWCKNIEMCKKKQNCLWAKQSFVESNLKKQKKHSMWPPETVIYCTLSRVVLFITYIEMCCCCGILKLLRYSTCFEFLGGMSLVYWRDPCWNLFGVFLCILSFHGFKERATFNVGNLQRAKIDVFFFKEALTIQPVMFWLAHRGRIARALLKY